MLQAVLALVLVVAVFAGLGWLMVQSLKWARQRGQAQAGVGHAFQELERLVTKPSIEYVVERESKELKEDEHGGE